MENMQKKRRSVTVTSSIFFISSLLNTSGSVFSPFGTVHLVTPPFLTENFLVIELDGVDTLVLLAGGYVFLVDEIQQVVVYLAGSNRFNLTPLEILLEIAEIGGIYPYGMVTVTHLLEVFPDSLPAVAAVCLPLYGVRFPDGGIVYKRHFHIAVEELGKHEILCRQISPATDKQYVFFLRQRQADVIVITESHFDKFSPVSYHRRKFDFGFEYIFPCF